MPWAGPATLTEPTSLPAPLATGAQVATMPSARGRRLRSRCPQRLPPTRRWPAVASAVNQYSRWPSARPVCRCIRGWSQSWPTWPTTAPMARSRALNDSARPRLGYWSRRSLPTSPDAVVAGPGSKALLFATLLALGTDIAVPRPSWVSYAAQATLIGATAHFVPTVPGEGGSCDPAALEAAVRASRRAGQPIGAVLVTLPDNPTGRLASPDSIRELCAIAERNDLIIISDEIYRDLVHNPDAPVLSPAAVAPERTVVTTALSKNLAVGGWRIGAARMPDGAAGAALRERVVGIASEIWSAASAPGAASGHHGTRRAC